MTTEQIIALVVSLLIAAAIVALIIFVTVRNNRYKKFVLNNSQAISEINRINKVYQFKTYNPKVELFHRYDNKSNWNKTEPVAFLSREIRNHLEYWFEIKNKIAFNKTKRDEYSSEIKNAFKPIPKEVCDFNNMNFKKSLKTEKKTFISLVKNPQTSINIRVTLRYISKKQQVVLTKAENFDYVALNRILDSVSVSRIDKKTYERLATAERAVLSDYMRYDVLRRDGFRCVLCGISAKDGAILHVDHIIPISKGGKTEINNLRTLCEKCNIGKSDKIE